jgi:hypothetical protein
MTVVPPAAAMMMTMAMVVTVISNVGAGIDCFGSFADWCYRSRVSAGRGGHGQPDSGKRRYEKRPQQGPRMTASATPAVGSALRQIRTFKLLNSGLG